MQGHGFKLPRIHLPRTRVNKAPLAVANAVCVCACKSGRPEGDSKRTLVEHDRLTGLSRHPGPSAHETVPLVQTPNALVVGMRP